MSTFQPSQSPSGEKEISSRVKEPKVVVIREEFIVLTGNPLISAVLNQLVYWSQRVANLDLFLNEENATPANRPSSLQHGWFYKTAFELLEETMLCVTPVTLRRYLNFLEERGWIETRTHPQNKWDRTTQYRVNLRKLSHDLQTKGYALPGYLKFEVLPNIQNGCIEEQKIKTPKVSREVENDLSKLHKCSYEEEEKPHSNGKKQSFDGLENDHSKDKKLTSRMENNLVSNTEITTENTNREYSQRTRARESFFDSDSSGWKNSRLENSIAQEMLSLWEQHIGQKLTPANWRGVLHLTEERKDQLEALLSFHFQNDIRLWEQFCSRIKNTPFLMGESPSGWFVTIDWILDERNLLKILEGNYNDLNRLEACEWDQPNPVRDAEKASIIASIEDPVWKGWCEQLVMGVRLNELKMLQEPLSLSDLQQISNARFIECEEERLVWVGSSDPKVLSKIDDLKLKLTWVFAKEYPKARTIRTRLEPPNSTVTTTKGESHV